MASFMTKGKFLNLSVSMMLHRSVRETIPVSTGFTCSTSSKQRTLSKVYWLYKEQNPVSFTPPLCCLTWKRHLPEREEMLSEYFLQSQQLSSFCSPDPLTCCSTHLFTLSAAGKLPAALLPVRSMMAPWVTSLLLRSM